ncbi:hypothetical protein R0J90_13865, partial [Micrococcus sp. SIMBA_144]
MFKLHRTFTQFWTKLTGAPVDKRVFAINLLLWLMIVGFLPGYFIHRQIFNQEKIVWNYVSELEDIPEEKEANGEDGLLADSVRQKKLTKDSIDILPPFY